MKVAKAILDSRFLTGSYVIEYVTDVEKHRATGDAHYVGQVVVATHEGRPVLLERCRSFKTTLASPLPRWHVTRGDSCTRDGFFGQWHPSLSDLLAECRLVRLDAIDRPGPAFKR